VIRNRPKYPLHQRVTIVATPDGRFFTESGDETVSIWLRDVELHAPQDPRAQPFRIVGTTMAPRRRELAKKNGWSRVRADAPVNGGCFFDVKSGECIVVGSFAWIDDGRLMVFGGLPMAPPSLQGAVVGPSRRKWTGDLGGTNYEKPDEAELARAVSKTLREYPGHVIVDGTDDWWAPVGLRVATLVDSYGIDPVAWWHTGVSGQTPSGALLTPSDYNRLRSVYRYDFGSDIESVGDLGRSPNDDCGCWSGRGIQIYRGNESAMASSHRMPRAPARL
jgi:hypothetical protein